MRGQPKGFWGKLERDEERRVLAWHPLVDHCADVAACSEALLQLTLLRRRLARLAGRSDLGETQVQRLCVLAALHDIGKFNLGFQAKASEPSGAGHVREALYLFGSDYAALLGQAICFDTLRTWGEDEDTTCRLLIASICHHGRPYPIGAGQYAYLWGQGATLDPFAGIHTLIERSRAWFPSAFAPGGAPFPDDPAFQHGFSGLVMLADWLGSDTRFFPFAEDGSDRMADSRGRVHDALQHMGVDPRQARAALAQGPLGFARICVHEPRPAQRVVDSVDVSPEGSLMVLEAETGSGKTEAALARFVRLLATGAVDGMYFALPTRTAATQIHRRVVEAVGRAFAEKTRRPPVVLAVPGYIAVDDHTARRLPGFEVLWNDDDQALWRARGWAAENTKRYLAGAVVVGTIDQILLSALQVSHAHLRASAVLRQLLVVDEVHASDAYMNRILEQVLARHLKAGGHALLMSATLGARARERFLAAACCRLPEVPSFEVALTAPFPQVLSAAPTTGARTLAVAGSGQQKCVAVDLQPLMEGPESVAGLALDAAARGARVLVVRNTVRGALAVQAELEQAAFARGQDPSLFRCAGLAAPHHSRFARPDREALDHAIEGAFGKDQDRGSCVCVATQTVQQSLDLDADLLVTDLCPLDVLLQRMGRLHRHDGRARPPGCDAARVVVLTPADRDLGTLLRPNGEARGDHGLGTVYEDLRILDASWQALEGRPALAIPAMNRALVEAATHPEALAEIVRSRGGLWEQHAMHIDGKTSAEKNLAVLNMVDWEVPFGDSRCVFPAGLKIASRLGEDDRRLAFSAPFPGAFGGEVTELTLPAWWARDVPGDAKAEAERHSAGVSRIRFGDRIYLYDRWGLRPEAPATTPDEDEADA